jgi:conjugative relaxase-like TrwC/TraI family protein
LQAFRRKERSLWGDKIASARTSVHLRPARPDVRAGASVLSVAKLALGQEAYYEQQVAQGLDDYYAGRGESPGLWAGSGAAALQLSGVVGDGELGTLLRGVGPADGSRLRAPAKERTITVRTLDQATGVWRDEAKTLAPVAGYDLVFSCPKSVSLLHALTDDESVRRTISAAHERSWQAALAYLEDEACVVRRGRGGAIRERGGGFVAAAFRHRTSRAQDPHLHTHLIVANLARSPDGAWRALDGEAILRTYRLAAGYLYEASLRHELARDLGVRWTETVKGMAEIEGLPEETLRAFSTRRRALGELMEALGTSGFAASRVAALATRERREVVDLPELRRSWLARAAEMGLGAEELRALLDRELVSREPDRIEVEELTAHKATITAPEIVRAVAGAAREGLPASMVLAAAEELSRRPSLVQLEGGEAPGRPAHFTTRGLIELEREALRIALDGRGASTPRADAAALSTALASAPIALSDEQRALVETAALSPDRLVCVVGAAGAGKTSALRVLGDALDRSGVLVLGAAPSGRAADELEQAGIPSRTLHSLLHEARRRGGLPHRCLLVVDEAGMAETRVLTPALRLVEAGEGKAVLLGDPAQLPAVGAGALYATLCERLGAVYLEENHRQRDASEREALAELRSGDAEGYLGHAARQGRLFVAEDASRAKRRLLVDWWAASRESGPRDSVMLAQRRADVAELNRAAQALMAEAGRLGDVALAIRDREFRTGDRVVCRRNDTALRVRNGTRAVVAEVDSAHAALTLQLDGGSRRTVPACYAAEHLDHGYALTGHAAQGASVERAFVLVRAEGALAEWGYVAASRARGETRIYAVGPECDEETGRTSSDRETTRSLAGALSRPAAPRVPSERERLQREIAHRERLRSDARDQLDGLGWLGRRRHADRLRREIEVHARIIDELQTAESELPMRGTRRRPVVPERSSSPHRELAKARQNGRGIGRDL